MQKNTAIISAIVSGIVILFVGYYVGTLVSSPTVQKAVQKDTKLQTAIKALSSKLVLSSIVQGNVTKISKNILTLSDGTDSIDVLMKDDAPIYSLASTGTATKPVTPAKVNFLSLKIGDQLNINIQVSAAGDIQGISAIIISPLTAPAPSAATMPKPPAVPATKK